MGNTGADIVAMIASATTGNSTGGAIGGARMAIMVTGPIKGDGTTIAIIAIADTRAAAIISAGIVNAVTSMGTTRDAGADAVAAAIDGARRPVHAGWLPVIMAMTAMRMAIPRRSADGTACVCA